MNMDDAVADLVERIKQTSTQAVIRIMRRSDTEAAIRAYAPAEDADAIKEVTQDITLSLLTDGLDIQVLVYDIATSLPPESPP